MPTAADHRLRARENEEFARRVIADSPNWALTGLFYAAVHWGRAYLASVGVPVASHRGFATEFVRTWQGTGEAFQHYSRLKDASEASRYDCASYSTAEVEALRASDYEPFVEAVRSVLEAQGAAGGSGT